MNEPCQYRPPRWADALLAWFCAPHLLEDIQGDLHELFRLRVERHGEGLARLRYWIDVIHFFRPYVLRGKPSTYQQVRGPIMLKNYFKVTLRNLRKHRAYAFLNISGLAIGLACFLMIALYIADEQQYDRFQEHADRIVRITSHYTDEAEVSSFARSYPAIGPTLEKDFSEVEHTVRFQRFQGALAYQDNLFNESQMFFAEASVFDVFTFPLVRGNPETALSEPNTVVLTESAAARYFGEADPMGEVLTLSDTLAFTVTGIARDVPRQSHLQFDVLLSFETWKRRMMSLGRDLDNLWTAGTFYTYALLTTPDAMADVQSQLPEYVTRYVGDQSGTGTIYSLALQPLTDIHLQSDLRQELGPNGSQTALYIFGAIAVFILLISCINFMNLATARSARRAREVGVRKALGAMRGQLAGQFLYEALLLSGLALVLAGGLVALALPGFNSIAGKSLTLDWATHWWYFLVAIGATAVVGVL
ncbi:MAG TPA: permease prefix domain 2-containing transporter, partial [Rhodothermales bacterium]|nr:permease prefix domain 2-containing transporter [Rhodothermales bacterium]